MTELEIALEALREIAESDYSFEEKAQEAIAEIERKRALAL